MRARWHEEAADSGVISERGFRNKRRDQHVVGTYGIGYRCRHFASIDRYGRCAPGASPRCYGCETEIRATRGCANSMQGRKNDPGAAGDGEEKVKKRGNKSGEE